MSRFPYEIVNWDLATNVGGIMYPAPVGFSTVLAMVACVAVLWAGNRWEHARYDDAGE